MKSVNRVQLLGNLGRDPEVKHTQKGTAVARLNLATNERYKDSAGNWQDRAEWHVVILWGKLAEIAGEYLKKGAKVFIDGKLQTRSWEDKEHKITRYATEVIGGELIMLTPLPKSENAAATGPITDEDIPF